MTAPNSRSRSFITAVLIAGSILLSGCSTSSAPTVEVRSASLVEQTPDGAVINLVLLAENPNDKPLPLREVRYTVLAAPSDGPATPLFTGIRSAEATVSQYGTQTFTLPAALPPDLIPALGTPIRISGELTYLAPGTIAATLFDLDVVRPTTGFQGETQLQPGTVTNPTPPPPTEPAPATTP